MKTNLAENLASICQLVESADSKDKLLTLIQELEAEVQALIPEMQKEIR